MKKNKDAICPICRSEYDSRFPALSRRSSQNICSSCGTDEALEDYYAHLRAKEEARQAVQKEVKVRFNMTAE